MISNSENQMKDSVLRHHGMLCIQRYDATLLIRRWTLEADYVCIHTKFYIFNNFLTLEVVKILVRSSWQITIHLDPIVHTMIAGDMATQGTGESVAIVSH